MTAFRFQARNTAGRLERGAIEAVSREEALARLYARDLTPLSLTDAGAGRSRDNLNDAHARDLARTMAQLLRSGLTLAQALRFASEELDGAGAAAARAMRETAERGDRPSSALVSMSGRQARLLAGVLMAGETSGKLVDAFDVAADAFTRSAEVNARVVTALIYPTFVISATLAVLAAFTFFVVPSLAGAFDGAQENLPQSTRDLLSLSENLRRDGPLLLLATVLVAFLVSANPTARAATIALRDRFLLSPLGLGIIARLQYASFAGLAALSLGAGVPTAPALEAAAAGVSTASIKNALLRAVAAIRAGDRPSMAIDRHARPPRTLVRLMQVGEETGDLAGALKHASELLASEGERRLQRLGAIAGPLVTLLLGGLVASVVVSLFLGLLSLSDVAAA